MGKYQPYVIAAVTALLVISLMMNMLLYKSLNLHVDYSGKLMADNAILQENQVTLTRGIDKYKDALGEIIGQENTTLVVLSSSRDDWSPGALLINHATQTMFLSRGNEPFDKTNHLQVWGLKGGKAYDLGRLVNSDQTSLQKLLYMKGLEELIVTLEEADHVAQPSRERLVYYVALSRF